MRRPTRLIGVVGLAIGLFAPVILAAPPVLDRVPSNALAVITTPSLSKLHKNVDAFAKAVGSPMPLPSLDDIMMQFGINEGKGFNPNSSSVAIAFLPPPANAANDADAQSMIVYVVQTSNYADFIGNFEAKPGAAGGIDTGNIMGSDAFFKDLGGGYTVMAPTKEIIENAQWKDGNAAAHSSAIGQGGESLVDASDLALIVFTQKAKEYLPKLEAAVNDQMDGFGGGAIPGDIMTSPLVEFIRGPLANDSTGAVAGVRLNADGIAIDTSLAVKEGSDLAGKLAEVSGTSEKMLSNLPSQPYLFAMAADISSPGARKIVSTIFDNPELAQADADAVRFVRSSLENSDGGAFVVGAPPGGLMTGLFTSTISYVKTSKPDDYVKTMREGLAKLKGQTNNGVKTDSTYTAGGADIEGTKVDTWAVKFEPTDDADQGANMDMAASFIFGPTKGPAGYVAAAKGGVYQTFGRNQGLLKNALSVGKGVEAFDADKSLAKVASMLPKNRIAEFYIGAKAILENAVPLMAMAGVDADIEIPPSLPPIGLGISGDKSGVRTGLYLPAPTVKSLIAVGMQLQEVMGGMGGMDDDDFADPQNENDGNKGAGQPRF